MFKKKSSPKNHKPKKTPEELGLGAGPAANHEAAELAQTGEAEANRQAADQPADAPDAPGQAPGKPAQAPEKRAQAELGSVAVSFEAARPSAQVMTSTSEEFRESLQTVQGALELLISGKVPDARTAMRFLGIAYREVQYLNNRANDLQMASMIEAGRLRLKLTALDLGALLNEIVQQLSTGAAESSLSINLTEIQELPALRGDEALMRMLLSNLVERCVRAAPQNGAVDIDVERSEDRVTVNIVSRGSDEPAYSKVAPTDSVERGLSLYIADHIAYAHEGQLTLMGEDSEVKAISLTLPLEVRGRGRGKILVVEDNPQAATLLEYALEDEGYEPLKAMNGLEGLKLARTERVDLVILDILLPGIDGFEVCHQLRADPKTASIPVIMVSAKARDEDRATALRTGADAYFGKPLGMAELMSAIQSLLEENQPEDWSRA